MATKSNKLNLKSFQIYTRYILVNLHSFVPTGQQKLS